MEAAILLALAASFCTATSSVCQRLGAKNAGSSGFDVYLLFRLVRQPIWVLGLLSMIFGFILQISALHFGALALVQPILALELIFVFGYMAVIGSRGVKRRDWLAAIAMCAGLGLFLLAASPSGGRLHAPGTLWWLAGLASLGVVLAGPGRGLRPGPPARRRALAPRRGARRGHRRRLGLRRRGDQGAQLAPGRRHRRHRDQLVAVRPDRGGSGDPAAGLARAGGRPARRVPARVHHPRPAVGQPARAVPVRRAHPDRGRWTWPSRRWPWP